MCFSSKPKVAKTNPEALRAPEPVMAEEPKGIEFGGDDSEFKENIGTEGLKVERKESGEGSQSAVSTDTGSTSLAKKTAPKQRGAVRRAMNR